MSSEGGLVLYSVTGEKVGAPTLDGRDVVFPSAEMRWTWVLDARHEPYNKLELDEVLKRAAKNRKRWVLRAEG